MANHRKRSKVANIMRLSDTRLATTQALSDAFANEGLPAPRAHLPRHSAVPPPQGDSREGASPQSLRFSFFSTFADAFSSFLRRLNTRRI